MAKSGAKPVQLYYWDTDNNVWAKWSGELSASIDITEATGHEGAPVTVGTSAVELTFSGTTQGISIQSDHDNTGSIWIGASNVDSSGNNAIKRLEAGESVDIDLNDSSDALYAVSDTSSQTVIKMAIT